MAQYTVKSHDEGGRPVGRATFLALDDGEAGLAPRRPGDQRRKELWRGSPLVQRVSDAAENGRRPTW